MSVTISREGAIALVTVDNPPVNALGQPVRQGLFDAAEELDADPAISAIVLSCAGRTFMAGADVKEFGKPPLPPHLPDLVARIEASEKPWIAAIHGSALGGGFEVALGCLFRIALVGAQVGLPEVTLGIVPGAGGTVRTPRLVGAETAVDMITTGKPVGAVKARVLGLIDAVVEADLVSSAITFANQVMTKPIPDPLRARKIVAPDDAFWAEAEQKALKSAKGAAAPLRALESVKTAFETSFDTAMDFERKTFLELRTTDQATALRHVFFAERGAARPMSLKGIEPRPIRSTAVIGGGTMGAGIAAALRDAGLPVLLIERDQEALDCGLAKLGKIFTGSVKRGRLTEAQAAERIAGVQGATDYSVLADTDLVIEAVFEDLAVKMDVFAKLGTACRGDAILATNTSYLDPESIAAGMIYPERFIGLHFFSPAHIMKLLEIVPTSSTSTDVLAAGFALAGKLRKIPVQAGICDGFVGNRILKVTRMQAEKLLLAGYSPSDVDAAMRAFGMPMGPFEAQDMGGLDIAAFQREAARGRGEIPFAPVADRLCAMKRYGRKTGGGWYDYVEGQYGPQTSDVVTAVLDEERHAAGLNKPAGMSVDLAECIVLPMVNEAARMLEEGIAQSASDIDLVEIHGYGFPRWRGGLMKHAELSGLRNVSGKLEELAALGLADMPCVRLRQAAKPGVWDI